MKRKISIIIPIYNAAGFIGEAIESLAAQTFSPSEIIVVDDGSTDNTKLVLDGLISGGDIKYIFQENQGPAAARNTGIKNSHGEFIAFLDADDIWSSDKLQRQMELFNNPSVGLVYSDVEYFGDPYKFKLFSESVRKFYRGRVTSDLLRHNFIPTSSVIVRRSLFDEAGYFLENNVKLGIGEDYHLWLRLSLLSEFDFVEDPLVRYRIHGSQVTNGSRLKTQRSLAYLYGDILKKKEFTPFKNIIMGKLIESKAKEMILTII